MFPEILLHPTTEKSKSINQSIADVLSLLHSSNRGIWMPDIPPSCLTPVSILERSRENPETGALNHCRCRDMQ